MKVSVIICTHNPRPDALRRVLDALRTQTLPKEQWELLLVDNSSHEPLGKSWDLSWHPHARHIRENELGLTPARLRGTRESKGEHLVFVDDDNIVAEDYLFQAVSIFDRWPMLGAVGASIKGEFEVPPPGWIIPHLDGLVVFELERDHWSNSAGWSLATPYGAGLCVRRCVAEDYAAKVGGSQLRRRLDRAGTGMGAGGDLDLAWCAIDLGMGTGRFVALKVTHLIPMIRLTEDYVVRLKIGFAAAHEILSTLRTNGPTHQRASWSRHGRLLLNLWRARGIERRILLGAEKARRAVKRSLSQVDLRVKPTNRETNEW